MEYDELTREEYARRASTMIQNFEGFRGRSYDANDNMATIGFGYTFNRGNNVALFDQAGVQLSDAERRQLTAIDNAAPGDRTRMGLAFPVQITRDEARSLLEVASLPNYEGPANALNMPYSNERAALVSVTYNRGPERVNTHMQGFTDAVAEGWVRFTPALGGNTNVQVDSNGPAGGATFRTLLTLRNLSPASLVGTRDLLVR